MKRVNTRKLLAITGFAVFVMAIFYPFACNFASLHYRAEAGRHSDEALELAYCCRDGRDAIRVCEVNRRLSAGSAVGNYRPLNLWWLVRNWNRDFLAEQPPCPVKAKEKP